MQNIVLDPLIMPRSSADFYSTLHLPR